MLVKISEDENHNKIAKPIAGATLGQGVPLGAWCSFEKDVAPSSNWLRAGTTFDATKYPALNLYLGTNKVPSRYDHDRPSEKMPINGTGLIPFSLTTTNAEVPYDGIINFGYNAAYGRIFYINDEIRAISGNSGSSGNTSTVEVKKGDMVRVDSTIDLNASYNYAIWFTHPLFIKATSGLSENQQENILNTILNLRKWKKIDDRAGSQNNWATPIDIPENANEIMINGQNNADWDSTTDGMNCLIIIPTAILTETAKPYTLAEPTSWNSLNIGIRVKLSKTQVFWAFIHNSNGVTNRKVSIWYR